MANRFWRRPLWQQTIMTAAFSLFLYALALLGEWYAVSPIGYGGLLVVNITFLLMWPALIALALIPVGLVGIVIPKTRRRSITLFICSLIFVVPAIAYLRFADDIRKHAFAELAERGSSLVAAIEAYTADHGQAPPDLENLVPQYLNAVPGTGMPAYPEYQYLTGHPPDRWDGNPWVLFVHTSQGALDFDRFLYFPLQNYPQQGYGGGLERIGMWAYVHE
jgi:hypothetical protein